MGDGVTSDNLPTVSQGPRTEVRRPDFGAWRYASSPAGVRTALTRGLRTRRHVRRSGCRTPRSAACRGATVRAAAVIERQPESVRRRIRVELESVVAPYGSDDGIMLPVSAKLASGRRS